MDTERERRWDEAIKQGLLSQRDRDRHPPGALPDIESAIEEKHTPPPELLLKHEEMELRQEWEETRENRELTPQARQAELGRIQNALNGIEKEQKAYHMARESRAPAREHQTPHNNDNRDRSQEPDFLDDEKMAEGRQKDVKRFGEARQHERERGRDL